MVIRGDGSVRGDEAVAGSRERGPASLWGERLVPGMS